jgi:hypothetical protein
VTFGVNYGEDKVGKSLLVSKVNPDPEPTQDPPAPVAAVEPSEEPAEPARDPSVLPQVGFNPSQALTQMIWSSGTANSTYTLTPSVTSSAPEPEVEPASDPAAELPVVDSGFVQVPQPVVEDPFDFLTDQEKAGFQRLAAVAVLRKAKIEVKKSTTTKVLVAQARQLRRETKDG